MVNSSGAGAHIMVVDDDAALLRLTSKYLARLGYSVVPYRTTGEAWTEFQSKATTYSLVIVDLCMQGISGEQLSRLMLGVNPEIRVILTSGYPFDSLEMFETNASHLLFLQKPFTPAMLVENVDRLLTRRTTSHAD